MVVDYLVWAAILAARRQPPGMQLLGVYAMHEDGTRVGGVFMYFVRWSLSRDMLLGSVAVLTIGIG